MKKFIILESEDKKYKFGLHLEENEYGTVGIVNSHFLDESGYELLMTDEKGENFYTAVDENPCSFRLPQNFSIAGLLLADIFKDGSLVASGVSGGEQKNSNLVSQHNKILGAVADYETSETDYFKEAEYYIKKAKMMFCEENKADFSEKTPFFDKIREDFDLLFEAGENNYFLAKKFKNSYWRKVEVSGEVYLLGKIFSRDDQRLANPTFVAIAVLSTEEIAKRDKPLGENAKFCHANIYDDFGFVVLVERAISGEVVNF